MIYRLLRASDPEVGCKGGEAGARKCEDSRYADCQSCGERWEPEDTSAPGKCPKCGGRHIAIERCAGCPFEELDWIRSHSRVGRLLDRVIELEFDCDKFAVPWSEVTAEERRGLQILNEERAKKQREDHEEQERERELQSKVMRAPRV